MLETQPNLVEELVPKVLSLAEVQRVLRQLVREQVSVRHFTTILETLVDTAVTNKHRVALVETVRQALGRSLVQPLLNEQGKLTVVTIDAQASAHRPLAAQTSYLRALDGLRGFMGEQVSVVCPTLICISPARFHLRRLLEPFLPKLAVLSPAEIPTAIEIRSWGS